MENGYLVAFALWLSLKTSIRLTSNCISSLNKEFYDKQECVKLRGSLAKLLGIDKQVWLLRYSRKKVASNLRTTEGYHFSVCQGKCMPNVLKGNAEK